MIRYIKGGAFEIATFDDQLSTNNYVDVGTWTVAPFVTKIMTFSAVTNNLLVTTYYSNDGGTTWTELDAEFAVNAAATVTKTHTTIQAQIKVQVKAAVGGSQGTLSTKLFGTSAGQAT